MKIFVSNITNRLIAGALLKKCKIMSNGVVRGSRDLLLEFLDNSISLERLKLETSNLTRRQIARNSNEKMQN